MDSWSSSPELSPLTVGENLAPLPVYKAASTTSVDFSRLLDPPLILHEDLTSGCGGQLWPAGMVLTQQMLRYHRDSLSDARILELGAGGGLTGLGVALGCEINNTVYISDQENMLDLMKHNISLNGLESQVIPLVLDWGEPLPAEIIEQKPNIILAGDCVYFEPAFPLLIETLENLFELCEEAIVYFCFKKRRKADMHFMKTAKKKFLVEALEDQDRETFSRSALFLYTFKRKRRVLV